MKGLICLLCLVLSGCSFFTPGLDARMAAEQRKETSYDSEKNLKIAESTTQNNRTTMVESDAEGGSTIIYNDDGSPKMIKGATTVLTQCSEPKDVMSMMIQRDVQNAKVAERMFGAIENLTSMIIPLVGQRMAAKEAQAATAAPDLTDMLKDYVREELRRTTSRPGG